MASNRANRIAPLMCNQAVVPGGDLPTIEECANDQGTGMDFAIKHQVQLKEPLALKQSEANTENRKGIKKVAELYRPKQLDNQTDHNLVSRSADVNISKNYLLQKEAQKYLAQ